MIAAELYSNIYILTVAVLTIMFATRYNYYSNKRLSEHLGIASYKQYILPMAMALFIGFRPVNRVFVDMMNYEETYKAFVLGRKFEFNIESQNFIFDNLFSWIGSQNYDVTIFFVIMALIYFFSAYFACKRLYPKDSLYAYVIFLGAFSTFSYATNGLKAGAAASLFLLALSFKDCRIACMSLLLASLGFHYSMILPFLAFIACIIYKNPRFYLIFWSIALLLSIGHVTYFQHLFGGFTNEHSAEYLLSYNDSWGGKTGFRYDFVLYSFYPIAVGGYAILKRKLKNRFSIFIFNLYVLLNGIWMLCMYANFTNRIAYLSWFLYPFVLISPFLNEEFIPNQYKQLNKVVLIQLGFTLFMHFLYY